MSLLAAVLALAVLPAAASDEVAAEMLWVAADEEAVAIDPRRELRLPLPGTAGARALALDLERASVWVLAQGSLARFDLDGALQWRRRLKGPGTGAGHLVVTPEDGSLWLARGARLQAFGVGGQKLHDLPLGSEARGLDLDVANSRLWVATADAVTARDPVGGYELRVPAVGVDAEVRSIALDRRSSEVWVAAGDRLQRFAADGQRTARVDGAPAVESKSMLSAGDGGLWILRQAVLQRLDGAGNVLSSLRPFGESEIVAAALDPATRSLWISDGRELVRASASGWELERLPLGTPEASDVRGLAVLSPVADTEPPVARLLGPLPGASPAQTSPRFEVSYRDDRSGVRAGSLVAQIDGRPATASCSYRADGATCRLETSLAEGDVVLSVTVADEMGNVSQPATARFSLAADAGGSQDSHRESGFEKGGGDSMPAYTPVASPRGFPPNVPFSSFGDIDHVDTASGNLVVTVPLGQTYQVGPTLEYQIRPVYNSNLWQYIEAGCPPTGCEPPDRPITFASTNYAANAGLGWELHFGRLYPPKPPTGLPGSNWALWPNRPKDSPDIDDRWMYVAPSGTVTYLHSLPGRDNGSPALPVRYSKDGSFIRMRQVTSNEVHVHMPNGLISVFRKTGEKAGTEFCGNGVNGCYRFEEMRDAYGSSNPGVEQSGNYLRVTYALTGNTETWTVKDSTGRQHTITFSHSHADTAGGDGVPGYTKDGDEWGDLRKVVKTVRLAAFGGETATYNFSYTTLELERGHPHDSQILPREANFLRTVVLDKITVPLLPSWEFTTSTPQDPHYNGRLIEVTLPSQGKIAWEYSNTDWYMPARCTYHHDDSGLAEFDNPATGVHKRMTKRLNDTIDGTWTYRSELFPEHDDLVLFGPDCTRANYRKTTVEEPGNVDEEYTRTELFYSVVQGPRFPDPDTHIDQWQITDNGLPYTKDFTDGDTLAELRFLSKRIYHCKDASCGQKRSVWVRYASEFRDPCRPSLDDSAGCYQVNPLLVAEKTVFHTDGGRYIEVENSRYDGAGNFRTTKTRDNFANVNSVKTRTDDTEYTATGQTVLAIDGSTGYVDVGTPSSYLPAPAARWILHPYSKKRAHEGNRAYVTEFQFNAQGSMTCSRRWKRANDGGRSRQDLVVELGIGNAAGVDLGLPVTETVAGSDWANLSTGQLCSTTGMASNGTSYRIDHAYEHLQLKSTQIAGFPFWYHAEIDRNTGLPAKTINAAEQSTDHAYDLLGRLTSSTPETSLIEAETVIEYSNRDDNFAWMRTSRETGGTELTRETTYYDHLGRPTRHLVRRPNGDDPPTESESRTIYDAIGQVKKVTTRQRSGGVDNVLATRYLDYDAFGRPGRIEAPDDQNEFIIYRGIRKRESTVAVRTSTSGTTSVKTTTILDSRGREIQVTNPLYTTRYTYDPYDQRLSARRSGGTVGQQLRFYGWDARGILLKERHPEVGDGGHGYTYYKPDAFGQRRRLQDDRRDLTYVYDDAGRLTQVKNTVGGRVWQSWTWADENNGNNYQQGKVVEAVRHNYPGGGSDDWAVHETYEYRGKLGKISKKITQLQFPDNPVEEDRYGVVFSQTFTYNKLGQPRTFTYPRCETTPQNGSRECDDGPNDIVAPAHTVTVNNQQGLPVKVFSSLGPAAEYEYHHNLQISGIEYSNGVVGTFDQGTAGMVRPQRLRYEKSSVTLYDSGVFGYDAAGNIWKIGEDRYIYDQASRLLSGTVKQAGANRRQEYTYDAADNITSRRQDGGILIPYTIQGMGTSQGLNNRLGEDVVYDGSGNMTHVGIPVLYEMDYDALNQQTRLRDNTLGSEQLYAFGPGEFRLLAFDSGERIFKFRDLDGRVLREYRVNGWGNYEGSSSPGAAWVFEKDYIYGPQGLIATRSRDGVEYFFHQDHLGTPRAISDGAGVRRGWRHYYPFGREVSGSSGVDEPTVKFTGHERDPAGLTDYMLARTYLFPFGRFASVDPARDGWNLYSYVGNNPVGYVDPDGRERKELTDEERAKLKKRLVEIKAASAALHNERRYVSRVIEEVETLSTTGQLKSLSFSVVRKAHKHTAGESVFDDPEADMMSDASDVAVGSSFGANLLTDGFSSKMASLTAKALKFHRFVRDQKAAALSNERRRIEERLGLIYHPPEDPRFGGGGATGSW